jgi:hypothetical protein
MTRPKRQRINIFQERLIFQAGSEDPVVYPPGYFGDGMESQATPPPEELDDGIPDDYEVGRLEEIGPEEEHHPVFYDDYDFDIGPEPETSNHSLYRLYDVFIYKDPNPLSSQQLYVMHDFKYGPNDCIVVIPNRYAVVALLNVIIIECSSNLQTVTLRSALVPCAIQTLYSVPIFNRIGLKHLKDPTMLLYFMPALM